MTPEFCFEESHVPQSRRYFLPEFLCSMFLGSCVSRILSFLRILFPQGTMFSQFHPSETQMFPGYPYVQVPAFLEPSVSLGFQVPVFQGSYVTGSVIFARAIFPHGPVFPESCLHFFRSADFHTQCLLYCQGPRFSGSYVPGAPCFSWLCLSRII